MGSQTSKGGNSVISSDYPKNQEIYAPSTSYSSNVSNAMNPSNFWNSSQKQSKELSDCVYTTFRWNYEGQSVYVIGTFTNWENKIQLQKNGKEFSVIIPLPKGIHRYKFIVDDEWRFNVDDPNSPDENGNINNIIDTTDYYLKQSGQFTGNNINNINTPTLFSPNLSLNTPNNLNSVYASKKISNEPDELQKLAYKKKFSASNKSIENEFGVEAPLLPPHLMSIYFISEKENKVKELWKYNQDNQKNENDNLFTETTFQAFENYNSLSPPNHVILNHLGKLNTTQNDYAVLVLTERFKGKYVTIKYHTIKQCESY